MKIGFASALAALSFSFAASGFAATIQVTGGTLTASASGGPETPVNQSTPMGTAPGVYRADASISLAGGHMIVDDTTDVFRINASAFAVSPQPGVVGTGTGDANIDFILTSPVTMNFSFQMAPIMGFGSTDKVILSNGTSTLVTCDKFIGGCTTNSLDLLAGTYHLAATITAQPANADVNTSYTFTMTSPVPLPLAAWLLCSGLAGVMGMGIRRRRSL